jgi:thiol-disulfide isomerase/thioredoxin
MKQLILPVLTALLLSTAAWAQSSPSSQPNGFRITGRVNGLKDTTVVLAHYFGATQYIPKDTARVDGAGNFLFDGKQTLPTGLYLVVMPKHGYVQFLLPDASQQFSFQTDTSNVIKNMKITGSKENELFYAYQQQLSKLNEEAQALNTQRKQRTDATSAGLYNQQMAALQKQAQTQRELFLKENASTFAVKLINASAEPEAPPAPKLANGRPDSVWVFNYFKSHFWDNYDFADERFVRSPLLQTKIDRYLKELTVQNPDSLIKEADYMVGKAISGKNKEVKAYTIWYITSQYEQPKVMGTDGLYVHMFEKYYATGVMPTTDTSTIRKIGERVATLKPTLVGKTLVSPSVSDTLRRPISLSAIKADYTVVFFYAPHCGHCRDSAPKLKKYVDANKGKGVEVLAIPVEDSAEEWKKFIKEFKLEKALNGYDYASRTNYRQQYDVWTTPTVYVLDKSKKILARKLPVEEIENFIAFHKKQQAATQPNKAVAPANAKASVKK